MATDNDTATGTPADLAKHAQDLAGVASVWADHHNDVAQTLDRLANGISTVVNMCLSAQDTGEHYISTSSVLTSLRAATGGR